MIDAKGNPCGLIILGLFYHTLNKNHALQEHHSGIVASMKVISHHLL